MNKAIVGLGSNIDPEKSIEMGRQALSSQFRVIKFSKFVRTPPKGNPQQPEFINGAALIETEHSFTGFKALLKDIETQMGRTNTMHFNEPRIIDFDIHIWNGEIIDPHFYQWDFLKDIILELWPDLKYNHRSV